MSELKLARPEFIAESLETAFGVVQKPLTVFERAWQLGWVRKSILLIVLALVWQIYAAHLDNPLLVPKFSATVEALWTAIVSGGLPGMAWYSIKILLIGYTVGLTLATLLTVLAISSRVGTDLLESLTSMFNPLPAIALLPLALVWFGLGDMSLVFVLVHSVLWAVALNMHSGFLSVSKTLRMVGRNYGLRGPAYVWKILMPAAFPTILAGLKIGWAFAWRTLIAAELVFGVSSGSGGLGWFIYMNKNDLNIPAVFAGLFTVILIGLAVENLIFRTIEARTVRRWEMQQ